MKYALVASNENGAENASVFSLLLSPGKAGVFLSSCLSTCRFAGIHTAQGRE